VTKKLILAFLLMIIGMTMLVGSFFINDPPICTTSITQTIFSPSFILIILGSLLLIIGLAMADVEYHQQTGWKFPRRHVK
jgi:uncharacterized membrane protein